MKVSTRGFRGFGRYLTHLVGDWRREIRDRTPVTDFLRGHITDDWIAGLNRCQFDYLERTLSAVLGTMRVQSFLRQGYTLRPWRPSSLKQPGVRKIGGYGSRFYDWDMHLGGWRDHPYRLTHKKDDGSTVETFISEPYSLDEDGMRSLLKLADEGWVVSVTAEWALHYPGSTLRVCLMRKADL